MNSHNKLFFLVVFILSVFGSSSVIAEEVSPRSTVEILINSISSLKTGIQLSPEEIKKNDLLSYNALDRLNIREISRKALGKYWKKLSLTEKKNIY